MSTCQGDLFKSKDSQAWHDLLEPRWSHFFKELFQWTSEFRGPMASSRVNLYFQCLFDILNLERRYIRSSPSWLRRSPHIADKRVRIPSQNRHGIEQRWGCGKKWKSWKTRQWLPLLSVSCAVFSTESHCTVCDSWAHTLWFLFYISTTYIHILFSTRGSPDVLVPCFSDRRRWKESVLRRKSYVRRQKSWGAVRARRSIDLLYMNLRLVTWYW